MKKLIVILILINLGCQSSQSLIVKYNNGILYSNSLYPIKYDKLWGYADFYGNTIINPQFEEASLFQYGTAIVKQGNLYGYISNTGQWLIKPKYRSAESFNLVYHGIKNEDGTGKKNLIAKVDIGKGAFYINSNGTPLKNVEISNEIGECMQILPRLDEYSIRKDDGTYELIYKYWRSFSDTSGYKVIDTTRLRLDTIIELSREFALLKKDSKFGIYCTEILRGINVEKNQRYLIPMDSTHTIIPNFIYEDIKFITINDKEQPSSIYKKDGKWGILTVSGNQIAPFIYLDIGFNEYYNTYLVEFEKQMFGYISIVNESRYVYNNREKHKSYSVIVEHFKRKKAINKW